MGVKNLVANKMISFLPTGDTLLVKLQISFFFYPKHQRSEGEADNKDWSKKNLEFLCKYMN